MYSIGIAASILGVCIKTLRRWHAINKIYCVRTPGGHRRFPRKELQRFLEGRHDDGKNSKINSRKISNTCAIYGRVSSHKQYKRGDLERQFQLLKNYAHSHDLEIYKVCKDIASGLNTKRKGVLRALRDAKKHKFSLILVSYKGRLTRFGYTYLQHYVSEFGVSIKNLKSLEEKSPESEMIEDLIAIIHSFIGNLYRMRASI